MYWFSWYIRKQDGFKEVIAIQSPSMWEASGTISGLTGEPREKLIPTGDMNNDFVMAWKVAQMLSCETDMITLHYSDGLIRKIAHDR